MYFIRRETYLKAYKYGSISTSDDNLCIVWIILFYIFSSEGLCFIVGVSACVLAYGAYLCGKEDVAIYDGAWVEWYQRGRKENKIAVPEN